MSLNISLTHGQSTVVDNADADIAQVRCWAQLSNGRWSAMCYIGGKTRYVHQVILERMLGRPLAEGEETDHRDCDSLNNLRSNLRLATRNQQMFNRRRNRNSRSPFKGITFRWDLNKWVARIQVMGRRIHLGLFPTPELAYEAYKEASRLYHGDFGRVE